MTSWRDQARRQQRRKLGSADAPASDEPEGLGFTDVLKPDDIAERHRDERVPPVGKPGLTGGSEERS